MIDENVENPTGFRLEYNPLCSALDGWIWLEQISGSLFFICSLPHHKRHFNKETSSSSSSGHYFSCQSVQN